MVPTFGTFGNDSAAVAVGSEGSGRERLSTLAAEFGSGTALMPVGGFCNPKIESKHASKNQVV